MDPAPYVETVEVQVNPADFKLDAKQAGLGVCCEGQGDYAIKLFTDAKGFRRAK